MIELETERLRLRTLTADDGPFLLTLLNDPDFVRFVGDRGVRTIADARRYIAERVAPNYDRGLGVWIVVLKDDATAIGVCSLLQRETLDVPDVGFSFLPEYRSKGYAFESTAAVIADAGQRLGLRRIAAITVADNRDSIALLERLGLRFERTTRTPGDDAELQLYSAELEMSIYDLFGTSGALLIVGAYLLLQIERLDPKSLAYSAMNAVGAVLILISLVVDFNLGAAVVEIFWLAVSGVGLYRYVVRGRQE